MRRFLFIIFLASFQILILPFVVPQFAVSAQEIITYDTSNVQIRNFSASKMKEYRLDVDFQYDRVIEPPRSLWDRFWDWFWENVRQLLNSEKSQNTFNTVLVLMSILILVLFILKLTGMTNVGLFGKKNKGNNLGYTTLDENIHSINFDAAIEQAIDERNFRYAVRLLYLQSLKNLTDRGLIDWQINKTNVTYVQELGMKPYQQMFQDLTFQFESNWYGDLPVRENQFHQVRDQFNRFNRQL